MDDINFSSKYFDIEREKKRIEYINKICDGKPMDNTEWLAHLLWIEYASATNLKAKKTNDKIMGDLFLPNFPLIDNSDECIDLIIKQLEDIKQNKKLSREFVHQYFYNDLWRKALIKLELFKDERSELIEIEYNILRKLYKNKRTLEVLAYIYNLQQVYCDRDNKVFSVEKQGYINPDDKIYDSKDSKLSKEQQYKMYYGGYERSVHANKSKLRRAIGYLIDNEPELLRHLGYYINEEGNLTTNILTDTGLKKINYYDVCQKIQDFLRNGSKLNPNIEYKIVNITENDTLEE